jgi:hypothetical protein
MDAADRLLPEVCVSRPPLPRKLMIGEGDGLIQYLQGCAVKLFHRDIYQLLRCIREAAILQQPIRLAPRSTIMYTK